MNYIKYFEDLFKTKEKYNDPLYNDLFDTIIDIFREYSDEFNIVEGDKSESGFSVMYKNCGVFYSIYGIGSSDGSYVFNFNVWYSISPTSMEPEERFNRFVTKSHEFIQSLQNHGFKILSIKSPLTSKDLGRVFYSVSITES